jgi:hypothetical protein
LPPSPAASGNRLTFADLTDKGPDHRDRQGVASHTAPAQAMHRSRAACAECGSVNSKQEAAVCFAPTRCSAADEQLHWHHMRLFGNTSPQFTHA